ncbi:hypothetical protein THAOC_14836 [Thalassiosira oceanica]|uniref:Uncharacterized protein n=1 Tax=Thalassiosira oceanica TaxID=159749 RepID=K0SE63_THAOC|nr:hypothetical protein THAOC_14836 [Thalassiosira oceanica]|eukprot:EJK64428.1 hypothetical protein THAOC_14836 [Thalassiosira oceanica]
MTNGDGHPSSAPVDKEQNDVRLTAAKTRANDRRSRRTRNDRLIRRAQRDRIEADLEDIRKSLKTIKEAFQAALKRADAEHDARWAKFNAKLDAKMKAESDARWAKFNEERDAHWAKLDAKLKAVEDIPAEEVVLGTTDVSAEEVVLGTTVFRDDEDPGEDGPPTTLDLYNFDDSDSEDGIVPMPVTNPTPPTDPDPPLKDSTPSAPFHIEVNTVFEPESNQDHKPELTFTSPPTTAPYKPSDNYDREWLQTSPPPDPHAPKPTKPRSTPTNASGQPSANYDKEWLQTSPPPDPSVPTPKRDSRNRQSTGYQTPAAHIHVQVYGYPPAHNGHGGYHSNVYMAPSDSEDDDASSGGYHSNGIDSDEYEYADCNYYRGDSDDEGRF